MGEMREMTLEEASEYFRAAIRKACDPCGGTGIGGVTRGGPDGETFEAIECEYCGRPMEAVRLAMKARQSRGEEPR